MKASTLKKLAIAAVLLLVPQFAQAQSRRIVVFQEGMFANIAESGFKDERGETSWGAHNLVLLSDGPVILAKEGANWPIGGIVTVFKRKYKFLYWSEDTCTPVWEMTCTGYPGRVGTGFDQQLQAMYLKWTPEGSPYTFVQVETTELNDEMCWWPVDLFTGP